MPNCRIGSAIGGLIGRASDVQNFLYVALRQSAVVSSFEEHT